MSNKAKIGVFGFIGIDKRYKNIYSCWWPNWRLLTCAQMRSRHSNNQAQFMRMSNSFGHYRDHLIIPINGSFWYRYVILILSKFSKLSEKTRTNRSTKFVVHDKNILSWNSSSNSWNHSYFYMRCNNAFDG